MIVDIMNHESNYTAIYNFTNFINPNDICFDGYYHTIDYKKIGTSGKPNEFKTVCIKCGKIFDK